jgi:hypothetical protein
MLGSAKKQWDEVGGAEVAENEDENDEEDDCGKDPLHGVPSNPGNPGLFLL